VHVDSAFLRPREIYYRTARSPKKARKKRATFGIGFIDAEFFRDADQPALHVISTAITLHCRIFPPADYVNRIARRI
jgi:hypothetical protein